MKGRTDIAALLIYHGADLNATCRFGQTPLENGSTGDTTTDLLRQWTRRLDSIDQNFVAATNDFATLHLILAKTSGRTNTMYGILRERADLVVIGLKDKGMKTNPVKESCRKRKLDALD